MTIFGYLNTGLFKYLYPQCTYHVNRGIQIEDQIGSHNVMQGSAQELFVDFLRCKQIKLVNTKPEQTHKNYWRVQ